MSCTFLFRAFLVTASLVYIYIRYGRVWWECWCWFMSFLFAHAITYSFEVRHINNNTLHWNDVTVQASVNCWYVLHKYFGGPNNTQASLGNTLCQTCTVSKKTVASALHEPLFRCYRSIKSIIGILLILGIKPNKNTWFLKETNTVSK